MCRFLALIPLVLGGLAATQNKSVHNAGAAPAGKTALASPDASADRVLREALSSHKSGDLEAAIHAYRAYLSLKPENASIYSNLGAALAGTGRYEEAIAAYQEALKRDASNPAFTLNLGLAYYKSGQMPKAASEFSTVRALQPDEKRATLLLADTWLRMGENGKVIGLLSPIEKQNESDLAVAYLLGTALIRDHQPIRGQQIIDRILHNGDSAEARLLMGTTKMNMADFAGALQDLSKAVELNANLADVYGYYGQALMYTGDGTAAMRAFRKELEQNPNDFTSNLNLGALLRQDQDYGNALTCFERALRVRPGDIGARYQRAAIWVSMGKVEDARKELEDILRNAPKFPEAHVTLATVYYRLNRKADGDRERGIVQKLNAEIQAKQPGVNSK